VSSVTPKTKYWLIGVCFGLAVISLFVYITGALDLIPRLHASANSPDGDLSIQVYRKRLALGPLFPRMGAIAKIYDKNGRLVYEETIYRDDDWDDTVGHSYSQISFMGDEIHIGPNPYRKDSPYILKKSELWNSPN
jgi:hypothetical protein